MNSFTNILFFLIITIIYFYFFKPSPSVPQDDNTTPSNTQNDTLFTFYYFLITVVSQAIINVFYISQLCGGSIGDNIGSGFIISFIPWLFMFGAMVGVLLMFPALSSVFANVIGYFIISGKANNLLTDILKDTPSSSSDTDEPMEKLASTMSKIVGNKSLLINEFNPENFNSLWNSLKPLLKTPPETENEQKEKLFKLVTQKYNIGEFCWYLYSCIFITSIVSYNTSMNGCNKTLATMNASVNDYHTQSQELQKNTPQPVFYNN